MPFQYTLTEGESRSELVTFDDLGFIPDVVLDWDVTSVTYTGSATHGSDYTVSHTLTEAGLRITVHAIDDAIHEGNETARADVTGYITWAGPPGGNAEFHQNILGDIIFGTETYEFLSDFVTVTIVDNDLPPVPISTNLLEILKGVRGTLDDLRRSELVNRLDDMLDTDAFDTHAFPDYLPDLEPLPDQVELMLRDRLGTALDVLDVASRATDIATADNWHKELWLQSWDVVASFDVTAGASLASGAALTALGIAGTPAIVIGGAVTIGASLIYTNYMQDTVREMAEREYDRLYPNQNLRVEIASQSLSSVLQSALDDDLVPAHYFDHEWYLDTYADARTAILDGIVDSPFEHWLTIGLDRGYSPNDTGIILARNDLAFDAAQYVPLLSTDDGAPVLSSLGVYSVSDLSDLSEYVPDTIAVGSSGNDNTADLAPVAWLGGGRDIYRYFGEGQEVDLGEGRDTVFVRDLPDESASLSVMGGEGLDRLILRTGHEAEVDLGAGTVHLSDSEGNQLWTALVSDIEYVDAGRGGGTIVGAGGNETLNGGAGAHTIRGLGGNDRLFGGLGNDLLDGGEGSDRMEGGLGSDIFVFSDGQDTIFDFDPSVARERIDLSGVETIANFVDLRNNHLSEVDGDLVIRDHRGNALTLQGVSLDDVSRSDFIF